MESVYHLCSTSRTDYQLDSVRMSRRGEDCGAFAIQTVEEDQDVMVLKEMT
jgi:hypothetical protein